MSQEREFYVGYLPTAPPGIARMVRGAAVTACVLAIAVAAIVAWAPHRLPSKVFEWNQPKTFVGVVHTEPVPTLAVRRPGSKNGQPGWSSYLLVGAGKFGADSQIEGMNGELVELSGSLIYREDQTMIEVVDGTLRVIDPDVVAGLAHDPPTDLGVHTFVGEIVDSKCYLGVMAPGSTKPHKACAVRCISGGIPPVLLVRQEDGRAVYLVLVAPDGRPVGPRVLDMIAEPVEISGRVHRDGDRLYLEADPTTYARLDG